MQCNIILPNEEFHFISFFQEVGFWSPTLSSASHPCYGIHLSHHTVKLSKQVVVPQNRCNEETENTLVFHSVEIPLQQKQGTYSPFDHGC